MNFKVYLTNIINKRKQQIKDLETGLIDAETKEERSAINATLTQLRQELADAEAQLAGVDNESPMDNQENRGAAPNGLNPIETYRNANGGGQSDDPTDSTEYRTAFRDLVLSGVPIPAELREDANTLTSDVTSVIPTQLVSRIIEKMDEVGMILPLFTRTSFKGGVSIPTSTVKPVATWVSEGAGSDRQKKTTGMITFTYHKLRCEISMSMEVGTMALAVFESKFVENVAKAMVKAIEKACLVDGDGSTQPKGILTETPEEGKAVSVAKAGKLDWKFLTSVEALIPTEYESSAVWFMTKATFMRFMEMTDANGQPIARVTYGLSNKLERSLLGRTVVINPYMASYEDAPTEAVKFAAICDPADYILNTIYDMGIQKKQDWDTEDLLTKAVMSCDGKLADKSSLIICTKANA